MTNNEVITKLIEEAATNEVSNAVFHVFALRKRARGTIMLDSLYHKMLLEGYRYPRTDYVRTIKKLADLGLGHLEMDRRGRVKGLTGIRTTLQSIGAAACGVKVDLESSRPRATFKSLPDGIGSIRSKPESLRVTLEFVVGKSPIKIPVPEDMSPEDLSTLIRRMKVS